MIVARAELHERLQPSWPTQASASSRAPRGPTGERRVRKDDGTLRPELLDRILIHGETHLLQALDEYLTNYNSARPHRPYANSAPTRPRPRHRGRSTSPSTGYGANPSLTD